jgi:hypothetical protein
MLGKVGVSPILSEMVQSNQSINLALNRDNKDLKMVQSG